MVRLNEVFSIRKASALDAFELFYEELVSLKRNNRVRRLRTAPSSSN